MVGIHDLFGLQPRTLGWIQFVLGTPVVLWVGWPILRKFWLSLTHRALNMYTLIGLGVGLAYLFSLAAVLAPGWFPQEFREHDGAVGTYFEAAAVIVTLKALRAQGGSPDGPVDLGFPNLARHFDNLKRWGVTPVIALNRFPTDTDADLDLVLQYCRTLNVEAAICEGYTKGGAGMEIGRAPL